jgi:hypothetical protein
MTVSTIQKAPKKVDYSKWAGLKLTDLMTVEPMVGTFLSVPQFRSVSLMVRR